MENLSKNRFLKFLIQPYFLLILIILFHGFTNWIVLKEDNVPFSYDEATHYEHSMRAYHHLVKNFSLDKKFIKKYLNIFSFYPPLYSLSQLPIYIVFGNTQDLSVMVNIFFLSILVFSIYGIGRKISNRTTGVFSSLLVSTVPAIFGFPRTNFRVTALTAIVTLSVYLLLKCKKFSSRKYSFLLGLVFGTGCLIALRYPIYILFPVFICIVKGMKNGLIKCRAMNFLISVLMGLFLFLTFWFDFNLEFPAPCRLGQMVVVL